MSCDIIYNGSSLNVVDTVDHEKLVIQNDMPNNSIWFCVGPVIPCRVYCFQFDCNRYHSLTAKLVIQSILRPIYVTIFMLCTYYSTQFD